MVPLGTDNKNFKYIFVSDAFETGVIEDGRIETVTERHQMTLERPVLQSGTPPLQLAKNNSAKGIILEMNRGWISRRHLKLGRGVFKEKLQLFFYWPLEEVIEHIDHFRFRLHIFMFLWASAYQLARRPTSISSADYIRHHKALLHKLRNNAAPVSIDGASRNGVRLGVKGAGLYLRLDYWARINSGGSYGHTCYLAKEMAKVSENFICIMGSRFQLLDTLGLRQLVPDFSCESMNELDLLNASNGYYDRLKLAFELYMPSYVYERLVPGNYAGMRLCQELKIPYIVEYNGSETIMRQSFGDGRTLQHKECFIGAEMVAFKQATAINVISDGVRDQLVESGVDPAKILVNPNCANPDEYVPGSRQEISEIREKLGWSDQHIIVGFIGTFGGWHGIEVLAGALPRICKELPAAQFLLIGAGDYQGLILEAVEKYGLHDRVHMPGVMPQQETAVLMKACDIFVSPHSKNMGEISFFGSPTKVFEYMSMAGGIVASDLEQIGQVLSPALRPADLLEKNVLVSEQRAVLCEPGNIEEFADAVIGLARRPGTIKALGANARKAIVNYYSWDKHVARILDFASSKAYEDSLHAHPELESKGVQKGTVDFDKQEIIKQWDNDPCGSHYVTGKTKPRNAWFKEVAQYRYDQYAPWMPEVMEFSGHVGEKVLEIGGGVGTDLLQFAKSGAQVTDIDMSGGHLALAKENLELNGYSGKFIHGDAENLPFDDGSFDLVYSNGVIHHTPNTQRAVSEIYRVLRPGGKAIIMVYAENSLHFWLNLFFWRGIRQGELLKSSMGMIMSRSVEISNVEARPLVKVYKKREIANMFHAFNDIEIFQRQLLKSEVPFWLKWIPAEKLQKIAGWNLIIKGYKS
jgi:glycosyltransferase involved in cell wall biosynthesis/ubiquinone/menaquinone biosynthesis C-methylase UbiE